MNINKRGLTRRVKEKNNNTNWISKISLMKYLTLKCF